MLRHHWLAWTTLALLIPAVQAQQQPPKAQPAPPTPEEKARSLDTCLTNWEKAMKDVESFEAQVVRVQQDRIDGSKDTFSGVVKYMKPNLLLIDLHKENKPEIFDKWLCTGTFVYQFVPQAKKVFVNELPKPKGSASENVFSMLDCLRAEGARKRYDINYIMSDASFHYIEIRPRSVEDKNDFTWARLVLRKDTFLPRELRLKQPPTDDEVLYDIRSLMLNAPGVTKKDFQLPDLPKDWKMEGSPRTVREKQ
jgi:TIGR03009 family protein